MRAPSYVLRMAGTGERPLDRLGALSEVERQMEPDDERALVEGLVDMDDAAWVRFARDYYRPLFAFVASHFACGDELSQEIVQMAFVRCVKSMKTFDHSRGTLLSWLKAVAANEGHTLARKMKRSRQFPLSSLPEEIAAKICSSLDCEPLPEEVLARRDVQTAVQDALVALDGRYARALVMKYVDDMSVAEIAIAEGVSEKAAESALSRSREAFRKAFIGRLKSPKPQ